MIALARGKIRLQIELKYYGKDRGLAEKVADLIRRENFEDDCEVSSLDDEGLMKAKSRNPRLEVDRPCDLRRGRPRPSGCRRP